MKINFLIIYIKFFLIIIFVLLIIILYNKKRKIKIGVIGLRHEINIGNNLVKYAIFIKLSELGFKPYIIGTHLDNLDISFIKKTTNLRIIRRNFSEIKSSDYDILMVNSDQTWRRFDDHFYDYGFLNFAKKWKIPKFIYGASIGYDFWSMTKEDEIIIRELLKNFNGISVREKGSIKLIEDHLKIKPIFVLDPTLLINKKYYFNLIKNYNSNIKIDEKYIFTYLMVQENNTREFIENATHKLGCKVYNVLADEKNSIEKFIYGIVHSKAVITNSFHGTIFSIIFNKPFVSIIFNDCPKERFISLKNIFKIENRIFEYNQIPDINLLSTPLNINYNLLKYLQETSINYLQKNLFLKNQ